jgi:hypothetical protein
MTSGGFLLRMTLTCASIAIAAIGAAGPVSAQVLLGEWRNFGGSSSPSSDISHVTFALGYDLPGSAIPKPLGVCIGCELIPIDNVTDGSTFDFDGSNTPDFEAFSARLTDGVSELMWTLSYAYVNSSLVGGGGPGDPDTVLFPTAPTWDIDFIRLLITDVSLRPRDPTCPGMFRLRLSSWQDMAGVGYW